MVHQTKFHFRTLVTNHPITLTLAYAPKNALLEQVVKRAARTLGTDVRTSAFNDSNSMYNVLVTNNYLAGIEFGDHLVVSPYFKATHPSYLTHLPKSRRTPPSCRTT